MKREEYGQIKSNGYVIGGGTTSDNIKTMLVKSKSNINKIILNRSSYIGAIETIHALKEEIIIKHVRIDNDLKTGNILFFCNDELIGECY